MSSITPIGILRIEKRLESFIPHLDMDDYAKRPEQLRSASLSRALAAYCVKVIGNTTEEVAARSITDTFHDRGIDAIYFDAAESRLLIVQAKWAKGIGWSDAGEMIDGVRRLIAPDWEAFKKTRRSTVAETKSTLLCNPQPK